MKKLTLIIALCTALWASAQANLVGLVTFTGDFTVNHLYDFNDPGSQPFGWFQLETVSSATGIFEGHVFTGELLEGAGALNTVSNLPLFTLNGLQFITENGVLLSGGTAGLNVSADMDITGLSGFTSALWRFVAPPFDPTQDLTGAITLEFRALTPVNLPDGGSTVALMGLGLIAVFFVQKWLHS